MDEFYYDYGLQILANLANIVEKHCLQINPTYIGFSFAYHKSLTIKFDNVALSNVFVNEDVWCLQY